MKEWRRTIKSYIYNDVSCSHLLVWDLESLVKFNLVISSSVLRVFICVNDQIWLATTECSNYLGSDNWKDSQDSNKVYSWKIYYKQRIHSTRSKEAQSNITEIWNTWAQLPESSLSCSEYAPSGNHDPPTWEQDICVREDAAQVRVEVFIPHWSHRLSPNDQVNQVGTVIYTFSLNNADSLTTGASRGILGFKQHLTNH